MCGILCIQNDHGDSFLSLSINGLQNYIELSVANNYQYIDIVRVPNAQQLLSIDKYYAVYISHEFNEDNAVKTTISINNTLLYSYTSAQSKFLATNQTNQLYLSCPWRQGLNASIHTICVNSSRRSKKSCHLCDGQIKCNKIFTLEFGEVEFAESDTKYLYFNLSAGVEVLIYAYDTIFELYDMDFNPVETVWYDFQSMQIPFKLSGREYVLKAQKNGHFSQATMYVNCVEISSSYRAILDSYVTWQEAEAECEVFHGTTLATIITDDDMLQATQYVERLFTGISNISFWVGLYSNPVTNDTVWKWVDGTTCNSIHWDNGKPDSQRYQDQGTAYLMTQTASFRAEGMRKSMTSFGVQGLLCNGPNSKYQPQNCMDKSQCWKMIQHFDDYILSFDANRQPETFTPPIAFWNSKLFVIGLNKIHYSNIDIFGSEYTWNHQMYNEYNATTTIHSQRWSQYQSSLYLYVTNNDKTKDVLLHINLNDMQIQNYSVDHGSFTLNLDNIDESCMVASADNVYIFNDQGIFIFNIRSSRWKVGSPSEGYFGICSACAITNDAKFIYLFGTFYGVLRYNTDDEKTQYLSTVDLCSMQYGTQTRGYRPQILGRATTAINDKIYVHGCYVNSWKTLIFNPNIEAFEQDTIDIDYPTDVASYRASQLAVMEDNVLLLLHAADPNVPVYSTAITSEFISLYFALTEVISINLTETIQLNSIWPSDGFVIKYNINDFSDYRNNIYNITFNSDNPYIKAVVTLIASRDNCICNKTRYNYNCYNCQTKFNLDKYLTIKNNGISNINIMLTTDQSSTLILPKHIPITLTRCNISFDYVDKSTTKNDPSIKFHFSLSNNCYSRINETFSLNIIASVVHIRKQLKIHIIRNHQMICEICQIETNNCIFFNGFSFVIRHDTNDISNGQFNLLFQSNMIDFHVISSNYSVQYFTSSESSDDYYLYLIILLILFIIICFSFIAIYYKREYDKAFVVDGALVLIIGCSQFDDKKSFLPGVKKNISDLKDLWRDTYNYDVFICKEQTMYSTKQDVIDFVDFHKSKLETNTYQCVILHVISHGKNKGDTFVSSDHKDIHLEDIKREFTDSAKDNIDNPLLKIIFNHCCRGSNVFFSNDEIVRASTAEQSKINVQDKHMWEDSNWAIVWGNIKDRALSDNGIFTDCVCNAFISNLKKIRKANFRTLITEIGVVLESKTKGAEICNINETLREKRIRFEKCKGSTDKKQHDNDNTTPIDYKGMEMSLLEY
eukprot:38192_1